MQRSQSLACCGTVLRLMEIQTLRLALGFAITSLPLGWVSDTHSVHPFLSSQDVWDLKTDSKICCKKELKK